MSSAAGFDRAATRYDELWTRTAIGRAQRNLVWRHIDPLFESGQRVLDIGCGTGEDAEHLAGRGVSVHAIDPSPAMIQLARARGGFVAEVLSAEDLQHINETFDGAISNFGALNCVGDLDTIQRELARLVRPGGHVAVCVLGRFCAWESLYYAVRFQFGKAFRRLHGTTPSSFGITVRYPTIPQWEAAFGPGFTLLRWSGIGLFVPPSYIQMPDRFIQRLSRLDQWLTRIPLLRALADHRFLLFVRN